MKMRRPLGQKGQIVIPKDLRNYLGLKEGGEVEFAVEDGKVLLRPALPPEEAVEAYVTVVKKKLKRHINIKKLIEEEVTNRVALRR